MQLGITLPGQTSLPVEQLAEVARLAERCGYHSLWLPEIWAGDAFTQLAYVAAVTERIKLGTAIVPVYTRSAALLAMSACSLDQLSRGRFILGLGVSGRLVIENLHGVPFGKPLETTREVLQVVRRFLAGERVSHSGPRLNLKHFTLATRPVQERLPIYLAAQGEKNIALAAEVADGWLGYLLPRGSIAEAVRTVHDTAQAAGRTTRLVTGSMILGCLGPRGAADAAMSRELAAKALAFYLGGMGEYHYRAVHERAFRSECEAVRAAWEARDREGAVARISDPMLDELALWGDPRAARRSLEVYAQTGLDLPLVFFPHGATFEIICATIEALAPTR
ncbi:MAG: LLM class flavin-dependent oxidoreductase [Candidatus Tectomicrobia bacterium]|nr:LLM class flavin-dependent oxidoreductase [Candidatus Tectomicrobia bacterium]